MINNKYVFVFLSLFFLIAIVCSSCSSLSSDTYTINRTFLFNIEKAFKREAKSGKTYDQIYNKLWGQNYYELIYLVSCGDKEAIDVSILLMGQKQESQGLFKDINLLAVPTYEGDQDYFWVALAKKSVETQLKVINICEKCQPIDWCPEKCYFVKRPELKKLYEAKYGAIIQY